MRGSAFYLFGNSMNLDADSRPLRGRGARFENCAEVLCAAFHGVQTHPGADRVRRIKTDPVIRDFQGDSRVVARQRDTDTAALRVAQTIAKGFTRNSRKLHSLPGSEAS